jgi:hypothetical protein
VDNPVNNVVIFDYSGNLLNSWMENGSSSSSTNSIVWVSLGSSDAIPAYSTGTIYLGFYQLGYNALSSSGPFGEAPQLSSTYAQYDDGASVFLAYFNGNTATSSFSTASGVTLAKQTGINYGTDTGNAIHVTGYYEGANVVYKATALPNEAMIAESSFYSLALPTSQGTVGLDDNPTASSAQNAIAVNYGYGSSYFSNAYESAGTYTFDQNAQGTATSTWLYSSVTYLGPGTSSWSGYVAPELYTNNGAYSGTESNNPLGSVTNLYLSVFSYSTSSYTNNMYYNWMRARIYPPNGVMPSAVFGSVIA